MEVILMRHGTTQGNLEGRFIGVTDVPLHPSGEELARRVGAGLPPVDHVYRSPLLRCRQTADLLWPGTAQTELPGLRETDFGPFEGKNHAELKDDPLYQQWLASAPDFDVPAGERTEDCADRAEAALEELVRDAARQGFTRVGVVSHGGTLMALLSRVGRPRRRFHDWMCPNCGGWRAEAEEHPLTLRVLGPVGGAEG